MTEHIFAVCAYGDSPYLERCIRSLKGQSMETSIVLCTSTPSPFIEKLASRYQIPVRVRAGESGIGADWNFAWSQADARLVTIAHQDDVYHRDYVKCLMKADKKYPDMTVFTTDYVIVKNGRLITGDRMLWVKRLLRLPLRIPALNHLTLMKRLPLMLGNSICCPTVTYKKEAVGDTMVRTDYRFVLDWDLLTRLSVLPGRFVCVEKPLLYYRVHEAAATKACIEDDSREREEQEMFGRFWPAAVVRLLMRGYKTAYSEYDED